MSGGPVCWKCKSQPTVAMSSSESEYMALALAAQEAVHLIQLSSDLGVSSGQPLLIWEDNTGAIAIAGNPISHERTKHIDIRHHFIREKVADKVIVLHHIPTKFMLADVLTKAVSKSTFDFMRSTLMGAASVDDWVRRSQVK